MSDQTSNDVIDLGFTTKSSGRLIDCECGSLSLTTLTDSLHSVSQTDTHSPWPLQLHSLTGRKHGLVAAVPRGACSLSSKLRLSKSFSERAVSAHNYRRWLPSAAAAAATRAGVGSCHRRHRRQRGIEGGAPSSSTLEAGDSRIYTRWWES